jgi:hypothetical protein
MKPIFLVIVGSSMLMPAMHQFIYNSEDSMPEKKTVLQIPAAPLQQRTPDSEMLIHDISFWIERLP